MEQHFATLIFSQWFSNLSLGAQSDHINQMQQERQNRRFLPDIEFPESLHLELDLKTALDQSKDILIVVPSHAFGEILLKIRPHLKPDHRLIWATKGIRT